MADCFDRSSADSIGVNMRSTVRKAARLAVYDEMMMRVKNHHALPTNRPDSDLASASAAGLPVSVDNKLYTLRGATG